MSEFREDIISGDWVIISPKRSLRPDQFKKKEKRTIAPKRGCLFEDPQKTGHGQPLLTYPDNLKNIKNWKIQLVLNKFPVLQYNKYRLKIIKKGLYKEIDGKGFHDLVITRDHFKNFAHLDKKIALSLFEIFQKRQKMVVKDKDIKYFFAFHNWGPKAGASIFHPHYQILSLPIIPPDVERSLKGSSKFFKAHKKCAHCEMVKEELSEKNRIVYENKNVVAFVPYAAKEPFELRIFSKKHQSDFYKASQKDMAFMAEALQKVLLKLEKNLGDPDYVFFIHTAPFNKRNSFAYYHWHIEVVPKFQISAGIEMGTGIEVTNVDPDQASKLLRKK